MKKSNLNRCIRCAGFYFMRFEFVDWKPTQSEIRTFHLKTCQHSNILHKNEIYSNDECFWWIEAIFLRTCVDESLCFSLYICVIFTEFLHSARVSFTIFLPTMNVVHKAQSQGCIVSNMKSVISDTTQSPPYYHPDSPSPDTHFNQLT